jgi:hypothetical protein
MFPLTQGHHQANKECTRYNKMSIQWDPISLTIRRFKKEYLNAKIDEPETNSKIKNITDFYRGIISDFKDRLPT